MTIFSHTRWPRGRLATWLSLAWLGLGLALSPAGAAAVPLRLEPGTNSVTLVVGPITNAGALFVLTALDLEALAHVPAILLQTNTPVTGEWRLLIPAGESNAPAAFFSAAHWPGLAPVLVDIPAGLFLMGSPPTELGRFAWEGPQTDVTFTNTFKMGKFEVTQIEYAAVMSNSPSYRNPSYFSGVTNRPVEQVTWTNAMEYCRRLTESQRLAGCLPTNLAYRLPTSAEWEYACRAGTTTPFHYGPDLRSGMANFDGFYEYDAALGEVYNPNGSHLWKTAAAGGYAPNAWGLYEMHANVWEWCLDWWNPSLPGGSVTNPTGPATGTNREIRGGCWYNDGRFCRSAYRLWSLPSSASNDIGFRVVLAPVLP
jgi:formylglycine-generating enzyme required for sulfatase activity